MQGTPLISPIFGTAALKDTGLVEGTVPIRIAGGALVGPMAWSQITTTPTTLNGYGITDGVRSVGLSLPAQFTISDSPVTGTGTLTAVWASQTQSHVLAAPSNGNGTPAFRALVATDIPTLNQNTTGTAANVTGIVAISNGGTGASTAANARTNLGATTVGSNLFTLVNPSAITFPRINADNTVSALNASDFRTAIGAEQGIVVIANANGTAWRFGGGLQICKTAGVAQPVNFPYGSIFGTQISSTWTFPAPFASPPAAFGLIEGTSGRWFGLNSNASFLSYTQFGPLNQSISLPSQLIAIGEYTP